MKTRDAKMELYGLVESLLNQELSVPDFCARFEHVYNFELGKSDLLPEEIAQLGGLFEKVIYYSPFPDEQLEIPHYLGEAEILQAVSSFQRRKG